MFYLISLIIFQIYAFLNWMTATCFKQFGTQTTKGKKESKKERQKERKKERKS